MLRQFTLVVDLPTDAFDVVIQALFDSLGRLTEESAASLVNLSPSWFSAEFRGKTGRSYRSYQVWVRVTIASIWLVKVPDLRISKISDELKYSDPIKFGIAFKKEFGVSPRAFRKRFLTPPETVTHSMVFHESRYNVPPAPSAKIAAARNVS